MDVENAISSEIPSYRREKKKGKRKDVVKNVKANHDSSEGTFSTKDTPLEPAVEVYTTAAPKYTEAAMLEPTTHVASEKKKKTKRRQRRKRRKASDEVVDNESILLEKSASAKDTALEPPVNIPMVVVPAEAGAATLDPLASVTLVKKKKKKKSKITDDFKTNADHESASVENDDSLKDTSGGPPIDISTVEVPTKADATALKPQTGVTSEKKKKKKKTKKSKITDDFKMNAGQESALVENNASPKDTLRQPPVNIGTVKVLTKAEDTISEPPTTVTSEKKKKNKTADHFKTNADHESALVENNALVVDTPRKTPVNIGMVEVPTKAEATMLDPANDTSAKKKRKKRKKRSKTNGDFTMNSMDHESAPLENSALVKDTPLEPPINVITVAIPIEAEEATTLELPVNVTSEKKKNKKKSRAISDSKTYAVDHENASLENGVSAKGSPMVPLVNFSMIAVPTEPVAMVLEPPSNAASEKKKKKKKSKTRDDTEMDATDHGSASMENNASVKDTTLVPSVNLSMIAVPTEAEAMTLEPLTNVASEKKKKKKIRKTSDYSEMNGIDHESASLKNNASAMDTSVVPSVNLSMIAVPPEAEAEALEPPTNVASEKRRKKKKSKTRNDIEMNAIGHESASLGNGDSERHLHLQSAIGIYTVTNSERCPSASVVSNEIVTTPEKKKRRKRSRSKDPTTNKDNENLNGATLEPIAVGREQQIQEIPHKISNERTVNLEKSTPSLDLTCTEERDRKRIRKQKNEPERRHIVHENYDKVLDATDQPSLKSSVGTEPEVEPQYAQSILSHELGEEKQEKFSVLDIVDMDHALQQNVHTPSQGDFVAEVAGLNTTGIKVKSPTSEEQSDLSNRVKNCSIKKLDGYIEVSDVPKSKKVETYKRRKKNQHTKGRGSSDSGDRKQSTEDKVDDDPSAPCLVEENILVSLDNKIEKNSSGLDVISEQVTDILIETGSVNHLDNDPESGQREKLMKSSDIKEIRSRNNFSNNSSKLDVSEEVYEQKNGGVLVTRHDAFKAENSCCKEISSSDLSKLDAIKIEITKEEAPSENYGEVEDVVHLDDGVEEDNDSQMANTFPERLLVARSKRKLIILDVNGILVEFVSHVPRRCIPDTRISKKAVFKRPYCDDFLQFCFDRFNVAVWSSRMKCNLDKVVDFLFNETRHKLLFCWDQSHCTRMGVNTIENKRKPLVLKELRKVWEKVEPDLPFEKGEYDETNTLLLDDSPYKALRNPVNTAVFPFPYDFGNRQDNSLGPGGDLRTYLEGLSMADNVKEYIKQNPFGQEAITKSHNQWGFYCKIIAPTPKRR